MDYRLGGTSKVGLGAVMGLSRQSHRRLMLFLCLALCAASIAIGARIVQNRTAEQPASADAFDGTWELVSLNGEAVGTGSPSPILSQRISFRDGKLRGETLIRANTDAATSAMPFPDQSVTKVISNADATAVRVLWAGTYEQDDKQQLALHVGKAVYFIKVTGKPDEHGFELNQDTILTIRGTAAYRRAASSQQPR